MGSNLLEGLNPEQKRAVLHEGGPLLILAGAGSGKTRVLTHRVAYLASEKNIPSERILLLTFTNKAAEEMLKRVEALIGRKYRGMSGTFHSFCAKVLRKYAHEAGLSENYVIYDTADQIETIKQVMQRLGVDSKTYKPSGVLSVISEAKNELIGPNEYSEYARGDFYKIVSRVYFVYQQLLRQYQALDFDDLLVETVRLLRQSETVRDNLRSQYEQVLVDEYQDTNKAQYLISKMLAEEHRQLTVVGDAAQAIYSWRGADYRNLLLLKQDFADLSLINLEQNYRSTEQILEAAYSVVEKNKNHPILKLWTSRSDGEKVTVYEAGSEVDEARFIVKNIIETGGMYADFAVLYRTNAQSRVLEETFLQNGIPYVLVGGVRFYERKEIKDLLCYLRLIINPEDEVSRKRAEKIGKNKLKHFEDTVERNFETKSSLDILDEVIEKSRYLETLDAEKEEDAARIENIKELRSVAVEFPDLVIFLENVALTEKESRNKQVRDDSHGAVSLMTLHAAKGLEFKTVFMVGMEEGLLPHSRSLIESSEMEEERRLCYVGMTRAKDRLILSYARSRVYFGQRNAGVVSRFVTDIPESLLKESKADSKFMEKKAKRQWRDENWGFDENGEWKWSPDD